MKFIITATAALLTFAISSTAQAFCGFYVARADTSLFNQASQVGHQLPSLNVAPSCQASGVPAILALV